MNPTLNHIGLDEAKTQKMTGLLNDLLANYSIFYQNTRGFHWNIQGEKFFELHVKFEELYNDFLLKIDEIAERILTLGQTPEHKYSAYAEVSAITESGKVTDGRQAVGMILEGFQTLLGKQRVILELAGEMGDEGSNALMSDYIREQEKLVWMYSAFMGR